MTRSSRKERFLRVRQEFETIRQEEEEEEEEEEQEEGDDDSG